MKVISPLDGGGQEVILTLIQGRVQLYFKAYFANFRTPPPLQIIIAQSLMTHKKYSIVKSHYFPVRRAPKNPMQYFFCCWVDPTSVG